MASIKPIIACIMTLIRVYRFAFSALFGNVCRFEPSCSTYAMQAIEQHGCLKGSYLSLRRILRCHPWHAGGFDQVPHCLYAVHKQSLCWNDEGRIAILPSKNTPSRKAAIAVLHQHFTHQPTEVKK